MNNRQTAPDPAFLRNSMAAFVQIGAVLLLLSWCFQIIKPFVNVVTWASIMAVAVFPLHVVLARKLGGRPKWSAAIIVLIGLAILLVPSWAVMGSTVDFLKSVGEDLSDGTMKVPPPAEKVREWPLIGEKVFTIWTDASRNLTQTLGRFGPQLTAVGTAVLRFVGHGAMTVLQFVLSVIIAGALLLSADASYKTCCRVVSSLTGGRGKELVDLAIATIRSVAKGVLGVALIQGLAALVVLMIWGVPGAGIWAGLVMALAIVQLPPILIMGPVAIWVFSTAEPLSAIVFLVLSIVISISDTFLKPLFLGRGMETPMLVILLGAIGGAVSLGIIGLFVGSIVLAIGYTVFSVWIRDRASEDDAGQPESA